ncbi:hypothetical protein Pfo_028056 [Paulownia fortunei]|nr:hypothetical protein Pfo_028056 [Paulownia fortunei]
MKPQILDMVKDRGWKVMVTGCDGDTLFDRQMELVKALKEKGVTVVGTFIEGEYHGYDLLDPQKMEQIMNCVRLLENCAMSFRLRIKLWQELKFGLLEKPKCWRSQNAGSWKLIR